MKKLLAAALVAAAAGAANADVTYNLGNALLVGNGTTGVVDTLTGTVTGVTISVDFQPDATAQSAGSWASDAALIVIPPAGSGGSQWGGFNTLFGPGTVFQSYWTYDGAGSAPAGIYTDTQPNTNAGLTGAGSWTIAWGNGWSTSPAVQYNNITVTLHGVDVVPAPGAAALLGLGGLLVARRRR